MSFWTSDSSEIAFDDTSPNHSHTAAAHSYDQQKIMECLSVMLDQELSQQRNDILTEI